MAHLSSDIRTENVEVQGLKELTTAKTQLRVLALIQGLKDSDEDIRYKAAYSLGEIGPDARDATSALMSAIKDWDVNVRGNAAWALGEIGPDAHAAAPALVHVLTDTDNRVRNLATKALAKIFPEV